MKNNSFNWELTSRISSYFSNLNPKYSNDRLVESIPRLLLLACATITAFVSIYLVGFVFYTAMPVFLHEGLSFITGTEWNYDANVYGIRLYIIGTFALSFVTMVFSVPVSLFTAIFLAELSSPRTESIIRPLIELLVGIPSVVYGIFGLYVLEIIIRLDVKPFIADYLGFIPLFANNAVHTGKGLFLAAIILSIMIIPTIISIAVDSLKAVPFMYREAAYSLGATKWEVISKVVIPAGLKGIAAGIVLGLMRAVGETMAIVMLLGNRAMFPTSIFDQSFALTSKILLDVSYKIAEPFPRSAIFGIAAVLFAVEIFLVGLTRILVRRKYESA